MSKYTCHVYLVVFLQEGDSLRCYHISMTNPAHKFELPVENDNLSRSWTGRNNVISPGVDGKRGRPPHCIAIRNNFRRKGPSPVTPIFASSPCAIVIQFSALRGTREIRFDGARNDILKCN